MLLPPPLQSPLQTLTLEHILIVAQFHFDQYQYYSRQRQVEQLHLLYFCQSKFLKVLLSYHA